MPRGPYKQYLDPFSTQPVPRSTMYNMRKRHRDRISNNPNMIVNPFHKIVSQQPKVVLTRMANNRNQQLTPMPVSPTPSTLSTANDKNTLEMLLKVLDKMEEENKRLKRLLCDRADNPNIVEETSNTSSISNLNHLEDMNLLDETVCLGQDIYVESSVYHAAIYANNPCKFITTLAYAVWGYQKLSERCIKIQKNTAHKKILTPRKKFVINQRFKQYLKNRNLDPDHYLYELNKVNSYYSSAIAYAKRQILKH